MRKLIIAILIIEGLKTVTFPANPYATKEAEARVKYIGGYTRSNGTYVGGHYRQTNGDSSTVYDNANYQGWNG